MAEVPPRRPWRLALAPVLLGAVQGAVGPLEQGFAGVVVAQFGAPDAAQAVISGSGLLGSHQAAGTIAPRASEVPFSRVHLLAKCAAHLPRHRSPALADLGEPEAETKPIDHDSLLAKIATRHLDVRQEIATIIACIKVE